VAAPPILKPVVVVVVVVPILGAFKESWDAEVVPWAVAAGEEDAANAKPRGCEAPESD
jgi:hypothetical protein